MDLENFDMEQDQEIPTGEEETKTDTKTYTFTEEELQRKLDEEAYQRANNILTNIAIEDPEFAGYLRRRAGHKEEGTVNKPKKDTTTKEKAGDPKSTNEVQALKQELVEFKANQAKESQDRKWNRTIEQTEELFEDDSFFRNLPDKVTEKLKNTFIQNYWVANQGGQSSTVKASYKAFKEDLKEMKKGWISEYVTQKKSNKVPVTPKDIFSGIDSKEEEVKITKDSFKNGQLKSITTQVMRNLLNRRS